MKGVLFALMIVCCSSSYGQYKLRICARYVQGDYNQEIYSDTLYSSYYNVLQVKMDSASFDQISMNADSAEVRKVQGPHTREFHVRVIGNPSAIKVKVYVQNKLVDSVRLTVIRDIPQMPIKFCGERHSWDGMATAPYLASCLKVEFADDLHIGSRI